MTQRQHEIKENNDQYDSEDHRNQNWFESSSILGHPVRMDSANPPKWSPDSWRQFVAKQQPDWPDTAAVDSVAKELSSYPPLVFAGETRTLQAALARVASGQAFLLQAGDCAESFESFSADSIRDRLKVILQMAVVLTYSAGVPVVKVGRIAGQFAKPRSSATERIGDIELPSFRGHIVNDLAPTSEARLANPNRMLQAYSQSASTLNLLRAFTKGGFADLSQIHRWNQQFVAASPQGRKYEVLAQEIDRALSFMGACGIELKTERQLHEVDLYTSHEALILPYEESLTRQDSLTGDYYACSAHFVWIGERTRGLDEAHIEFFRGIKNPVGVKLGPSTTREELLGLCQRLDPQREAGRLTLITRMGTKIEDTLPPLIDAVRQEGHPVIWECDPMHANTFTSSSGHKTRRLDDIISELSKFFAIHRAIGTWPGGVHLELTGDAVTECLGGSIEIAEPDLAERYETMCDPRLNAQQGLDLAFYLADLLRNPR